MFGLFKDEKQQSLANRFLNQYWEEFVNHISQFYKFDREFMEKYQYELEWHCLSKNRLLDWDDRLIDKYIDRYTWHRLCVNPAIMWSPDRIEKYKKYVVWDSLAMNPALPINEDFLDKYNKKLKGNWFTADNSVLTPKLIAAYNLKIFKRDQDDEQPEEKPVPWVFNEGIFRMMEENALYMDSNDELFYKHVCLPVIKEKELETIFEERFDYSQQFFFLKSLWEDHHGLLPDFKLKNNPFDDESLRDDIFKFETPPVFVQEGTGEGPPRLHEILRRNAQPSYVSLLLVSEPVKNILAKFRLPRHSFTEVILQPKKLKNTARFFLLQLENNALYKSMDYKGIKFIATTQFYADSRTFSEEYKEPIKSYPDIHRHFWKYHPKVKKMKEADKGFDLSLEPLHFPLTDDYDVYTYYGDIIINEFVKAELERHFTWQFKFESAQKLKIRQTEEVYESKRKRILPHEAISHVIGFEISEEARFYTEKKERLENNDIPFDFKRLAPDALPIERKLNVVIPEKLRNAIAVGKLNLQVGVYTFLSPAEFYRQTEYCEAYPESFKAIVIAEDGGGDTLGLILEKDDDHRLSPFLYEFKHETGEVVRF